MRRRRRLELLQRVGDDRDVMRIDVEATADGVGERPGFEVNPRGVQALEASRTPGPLEPPEAPATPE